MGYKINSTTGQLIVDLIDGRIDTDSTDLTLIGRNYTSYGELFNENFVRLLENFASSSPPPRPIVGQIWYDTSDGRLKVYNGVEFRSSDTTIVSATQPVLLAGDIWIDTARRQLYFSDGSAVTLAGPIYTRTQGETGFKVETLTDRFGVPKTIAKLMIGETPVALISKDTFTSSAPIPGFNRDVKIGFNLTTDVNFQGFEYRGTATTARYLLDNIGNSYTPSDFLIKSQDSVVSGALFLTNNNGLTVGLDNDFVVKTEAGTVINRVQNNNASYKLQVNLSESTIDAIYVDTPNKRVGIWNSNPQYTMDLIGDLMVTGDIYIGNTQIGTGGGGGGASVFISDNPPEFPSTGDLWFSSEDTTLNIYYADGDSSQWVVASGADGRIGYTGSLGETGFVGSQGDLGYTGSRGFTGSQGAGFTGSQGIQGDFGYTGSRGFTGSQGAGFTGSQGVTGFTGSKGDLPAGSLFTWRGARRTFTNFTMPSAAAWNQIALDAATIDTNAFANTANGFTIPAGVSKIKITVTILHSTGTTPSNQWTVYKNGSLLSVAAGGFASEVDIDGYSNGAISASTAALNVVEGDVFDLRGYVSTTTVTWSGWIQIDVIEGSILGTFYGGIGFTGSSGAGFTINNSNYSLLKQDSTAVSLSTLGRANYEPFVMQIGSNQTSFVVLETQGGIPPLFARADNFVIMRDISRNSTEADVEIGMVFFKLGNTSATGFDVSWNSYYYGSAPVVGNWYYSVGTTLLNIHNNVVGLTPTTERVHFISGYSTTLGKYVLGFLNLASTTVQVRLGLEVFYAS